MRSILASTARTFVAAGSARIDTAHGHYREADDHARKDMAPPDARLTPQAEAPLPKGPEPESATCCSPQFVAYEKTAMGGCGFSKTLPNKKERAGSPQQ
jgi:hypothetical protein